jgi:NADH dehydrogenase
MNETKRIPEVIVVGAGFGGLATALALRRAKVNITLVDRTNHHLFQPLLYQVAIAGLSPADIAAPVRGVLHRQRNVTVLLDEARGVDYERQVLQLSESELPYDYLVLATGARTSYFGHDDWERFAPGLKSLDDAIEIRQRVLLAFEEAERETDAARQRELLTFVVVGGGPTGVELAGAIAELSRFALARDFRRIHPEAAEILLLEGGPRILPSFAPELAESAVKQLNSLGVKVRSKAQVTNIDAEGVYLGAEIIRTPTVIWGAGVRATAWTETLDTPLDRAGRIILEKDLTLPGRRNVFAIGDMTFLEQDGKPLPGVSPVAMQMGRLVARNIQQAMRGSNHYEEFRYFDKGSMATIGRSRAIAEMGRLHLSGWLAWMGWLVVHLFFLITFRNRVSVLLNWMWSYFSYQRGARLITGRGLALRQLFRRKTQ